MKISNIVEVNLKSTPSYVGSDTDLNTTAGVLVVLTGAGTIDNEWKPAADLLADGVTWPGATVGADGKEALNRLSKTYSSNGGLNLVVKRIYKDTVAVESDLVTELSQAVKGGGTHIAVDNKVVNIMLIDESNEVSAIGTLATNLSASATGVDPNEEKILMLNVLASAIPSIPLGIDNVFINVYDQKAEGGATTQNNYEVALAAAYVSKIDYTRSQIKGYEYTEFLGYSADKNNLNIALDKPAGDTYVNFITPLINRYLAIGGVMTNGANFIAKYFSIILTQKITDALLRLVVGKLKFENAAYSAIANTLTVLLDTYTRNGLLDTEFVSDIERQVVIEEPSGSTLYRTVERGEIFTEGYKVFTLPPSVADLANKTYSGVYVYIAIGNQIRTIKVDGLVLGGV